MRMVGVTRGDTHVAVKDSNGSELKDGVVLKTCFLKKS